MIRSMRHILKLPAVAMSFIIIAMLAPSIALADCPEGGCSSIAQTIINSGRVTFWNYHVSGVDDNATALKNIYDTGAGLPAQLSNYCDGDGCAPGGSVYLSKTMLTNLYYLSSAYQLEISELAGGSHSVGSTHYSGTAFDIVKINGIPVSSENPYYQDVMQWCRNQGGTTYGPGDAGHSSHIHCNW